MKLIYRRLVYLFFLIIFLVTAPSVILYTQGYRLNIKRGTIQKTGILIVSSLPKRADVYLNNQLVAGDPTPTRIEQLLPADYEIKVTKEGYHSWQKKLRVYENTTTFAEDIILWKQTGPITLTQHVSQDWLAAPDQQKIVTIDQNNQVIMVEFNFNQLSNLADLSRYLEVKILGWSNTSKKILLAAQDETVTNYYVINIEQQPRPKLMKIPDNKYTKVKWDTSNDSLVYALNQQGLWQIDLFQDTTSLIGPLIEHNFLIKQNKLYTCQEQTLVESSLSNLNETRTIYDSNCQRYSFINKDLDKLILHDPKSQDLLVIDPDNTVKPVQAKAKALDWLDNNTLLYYTDWELWIFDLNKNEPELITRLGSQIQQAIWHPEGRHIIFACDNTLKVIELDNRELRNMVELVHFNQLDKLEINHKGTDLYLQAEITNQPEIIQLNIR